MLTSNLVTALPDPLRFFDVRPVAAPADWPARRAELLESIQAIEYGHLPPAPESLSAYPLHTTHLTPDYTVEATQYQLTVMPGGLTFLLTVVAPVGRVALPIIITGDDCWRKLTDDILLAAVARGYAVAYFNRLQFAPDNGGSTRDLGLYTIYPEGDFGALAAWAWGYHRAIDFVCTLGAIDPARIIVTGHSRGGKTALLAGVTDERVMLTVPNNSGNGGTAPHRFPDLGGEQLADSVRNFPYWYAGALRAYVGREQQLPFDQHSLIALAAPRAILCTEARGDTWASPHGARLSFEAAREVFRFLNVPEHIGIVYREGGHGQLYCDWETILDFADDLHTDAAPSRNYAMAPEA